MARSQSKSVRKLVTLSAELAERVDKYREATSAASESGALKALIEDGLKLHDRPADLFERCKTATAKGQSLGDIINLLAADHPLVHSTYIHPETVVINLKEDGSYEERFVYGRLNKTWDWERNQ